jgi:hydrogenase nickel incorporation protein HypB
MEKIVLNEKILSKNDLIAQELRNFYKKHKIYVINILSSPGSGKTSLLEKILPQMKEFYNILVLVGDLQTNNDALRIAKTGVNALQINTGQACHLDAKNIYNILKNIEDPSSIDLLIIENVGNLVCPASFDLGEDMKLLVISTPEGDDKPAKYPTMVDVSDCLIINKIDLLPYVDFNIQNCINYAKRINKNLTTFTTSCYTEEGLRYVVDFLKQRIDVKKHDNGRD